MVTNNKIDNNLAEAYEYCIDFALDLIFFNLSLLIAGFITHNFILSVIYVFMLVPVKMLAGGAHASSPISCFILSWSIYTTCILLCHVIPDVRILNIMIYSLAGIGICILAPVEHKNKHYSGADRIRSKHCCTLLLVIIFYIAHYYGIISSVQVLQHDHAVQHHYICKSDYWTFAIALS